MKMALNIIRIYTNNSLIYRKFKTIISSMILHPLLALFKKSFCLQIKICLIYFIYKLFFIIYSYLNNYNLSCVFFLI